MLDERSFRRHSKQYKVLAYVKKASKLLLGKIAPQTHSRLFLSYLFDLVPCDTERTAYQMESEILRCLQERMYHTFQ